MQNKLGKFNNLVTKSSKMQKDRRGNEITNFVSTNVKMADGIYRGFKTATSRMGMAPQPGEMRERAKSLRHEEVDPSLEEEAEKVKLSDMPRIQEEIQEKGKKSRKKKDPPESRLTPLEQQESLRQLFAGRKEEEGSSISPPRTRSGSQKKEGKGIQVFQPKQLITRLPVLMAQLKAGNNSRSLINEIKQISYSLLRSKHINKTTYNRILIL